MFDVSDQAILGLRSADRGAYVGRLSEFLARRYHDARELDEADLRLRVDAQITKALQHGFRTERQGAKYVLTAWLWGADFDECFPDAARVLESDIAPEDKARQIEYWSLETLGKERAPKR